MGRFSSIFFGFVLPPIIGALCFALFLSLAAEVIEVIEVFALFILFIPFAFFIVGIQSLIFSLVMEFIILVKVSDVKYVIASGCALGVLSSFFMGAVFCVIGAIVGGLSSYFLYRRYKVANKSI